MKKNIVFIMNNLNCGGAEKALISLLESIDYSKYDVDLFLFKHEGIFMSKIPKQVNLLDEPKNYKYFDMSIKQAIPELIKMKKFNLALARTLSLYEFKKNNCNTVIEQKVWKYLSRAFINLNKEYDVAIGYLEKSPVYFCVDKVKAKKKIGWIHNDYEKLGMDKNIDNKYFNNLDYVFTVSQECLNVLKRVFPQYKSKFKIMHNIVSVDMIKKLALDEVTDIKFNKNNINIVSVGRLTYQKGFDIAIEACHILIKKGYKIKWYIIGEGEDREKLEKLINKFELHDVIQMIGIRENPYSYVGRADIYVQPSRFEGKSIAIDEAKILGKAIIVTNFSTAKDQILNKNNGLICSIDSMELANSIEKIILDKDLKLKLENNLKFENLSNEYEINNLYSVI